MATWKCEGEHEYQRIFDVVGWEASQVRAGESCGQLG